MKKSCVDYLTCIECGAEHLDISVDQSDDDEIMEGAIRCSCGAAYPIIRGVPRMFTAEMLKPVLHEYGVSSAAQVAAKASSDGTVDVQRRTMDAFGFEWREYNDYDANNYYDWMPEGFEPAKAFSGKIGLEVGCGAGRHAEITSKWAKVHFAVDLSYAVDSAFERLRKLPNCHVIQADAFNLPFKKGHIFDYVYCLGVLQHMHNPPAGFRMLAELPKTGGTLLVNVYQSSRPVVTGLLQVFRNVTTRIPARPLNWLCWVLGTIDYGFSAAWRAADKAGLGKILSPVVPKRTKEYAKHSYATSVADWYDRLSCPEKYHYSDQELASWYKDAGYSEIRVTPYWKAFWNGFGVRA